MMRTIHIEGGSSAAGYFDLQRGGWANRLHLDALTHSQQNILRPTVVDNRAKPGRTLAAIMRTLEADTEPARRAGPVALAIQVGLNEVKIFPEIQRPTVSLQLFESQLQRLGDMAARQQMLLVLVGPQQIDEERAHPNPGGCIIEDDLLEEYATTMRSSAKEYGASYVDSRSLVRGRPLHTVLAADGYHYNEVGHGLVYEAVRDALVQINMLGS